MLFHKVQILADDERRADSESVVLADVQKARHAIIRFWVFYPAGPDERTIEGLICRIDFDVFNEKNSKLIGRSISIHLQSQVTWRRGDARREYGCKFLIAGSGLCGGHNKARIDAPTPAFKMNMKCPYPQPGVASDAGANGISGCGAED